ncbi:EamA/RhaT family transporter [Pseudoxanthomonas gei]|uniref:EamA/RhaT family transporter n=2 Tax=Pseudoxanthomonas gei TaxID=1383030 RepID=A0ABX0ADD0_9GAMM|nr:EamA/RhaT family transporter [Pseudoxanthomonas gei]
MKPARVLPRAGGGLTVLGLSFVMVWCTGYIAGRMMLDHAAPFTALVWRFAGAAMVFAVLALAVRARASRRDVLHSAVAGVLMLSMQFGGVYLAMAWGASAGVAALVIGAMPLLVALLAFFAGTERPHRAQWCGLLLGFAGVVLVVVDRVDGATSARAWIGLLVGLLGISLGTLYQKRYSSKIDLRIGLAVQNLSATLVLLPLALAEGFRFESAAGFYQPLAWTVLVNSVGGFALLFVLVRRDAATAVASLFFLMPPVTALFGHWLLGEHLTVLKGAGFVLAAAGVWLATRTPRRAAED